MESKLEGESKVGHAQPVVDRWFRPRLGLNSLWQERDDGKLGLWCNVWRLYIWISCVILRMDRRLMRIVHAYSSFCCS